MEKIILDLHRGNFDAFQRAYSKDSEETKAFLRVGELEEKVSAALNPENRPLLKEYAEAFLDLVSAACDEDYLAGYRLGVQMMLAAWPKNKL